MREKTNLGVHHLRYAIVAAQQLGTGGIADDDLLVHQHSTHNEAHLKRKLPVLKPLPPHDILACLADGKLNAPLRG